MGQTWVAAVRMHSFRDPPEYVPTPSSEQRPSDETKVFAMLTGTCCHALPGVDSAVPRLQCQGTELGWGYGKRPLGFGGKSTSFVLVF